MPITYKEIKIDSYIKADIMVNNTILLELKTVEEIHPIYKAQLLSYMKLLNCPKGVIINFLTEKITESAVHLVNELFSELPKK